MRAGVSALALLSVLQEHSRDAAGFSWRGHGLEPTWVVCSRVTVKFRTVLLGCLLHGASVPALAFEAAGRMFPVTLRVQGKDQRRLKTHNKRDGLEVLSLVVLVAAEGPEAEGMRWSLALGKVLVLPCTSALCKS